MKTIPKKQRYQSKRKEKGEIKKEATAALFHLVSKRPIRRGKKPLEELLAKARNRLGYRIFFEFIQVFSYWHGWRGPGVEPNEQQERLTV